LKIAIMGAGSMGMLFGSYLSKENEVLLIDVDGAKVEKINREGIRIREADGRMVTVSARAALPAQAAGPVDLVLLFVKAMDSRQALENSRTVIGAGTLVMSLQNGSGHDAVIRDFVSEDRIVLGTTQHNSSITETGLIHHGGGGKTYIGLIKGDKDRLIPVEETLNRCGIDTQICTDIRRKIWEKLFLNASVSALTAILQVKLGFLTQSWHAWLIVRQLIKEAVAVARAEGFEFDEDSVAGGVRRLLERASEGLTSICADVRDGRRSEVDTISGAVVEAGKRNGVPVPGHELVVLLIHAMEDRGSGKEKQK
jgi:2-dehydropantoate 2-reductase